MATIEDLKRALGNAFYKDLARFEPGKVGVVLGDNLRIYLEGDAFVLRFLAGTPFNTRKPVVDRLRQAGLTVSEGEDFRM